MRIIWACELSEPILHYGAELCPEQACKLSRAGNLWGWNYPGYTVPSWKGMLTPKSIRKPQTQNWTFLRTRYLRPSKLLTTALSAAAVTNAYVTSDLNNFLAEINFLSLQNEKMMLDTSSVLQHGSSNTRRLHVYRRSD